MLEPEKLTGKRLGKYVILEQIATGGMAVLYKARDTSLNRHVALKVLLSSLAVDSSMVARFHREAEATAKLSHPNIVPVYDVGEEEGVHYIAMEYVEGESLSEIIVREAPLAPERALGIVEQVAHGLAAAHEADLIHRDIKPGNILIDRKGRARLTDFGLVQISEGTRITDARTLLGTAQYMSPEQCCGARLDPRSDIFSLGIVLYRMLSGKLPFTGETPVSITYQIVEEETVPIRKLQPDIPPEIDKIVRKMMAKKVEDRYQSADELLEDIRAYMQRPEQRRRLHPVIRAVAAGAVLALIVFVYNLWKNAQLDEMAKELGIMAPGPRGSERIVLAQVTGLMRDAEAQMDRGMTANAADNFQEVLQLASDHRRAKLGLGYCLAELGDFDRAESMFINVGPDGGYDKEGLAAVRYAQGKYSEAMELCEEVEAEFPENAYVHTIKGNIHYVNGELDEAINEYETGLQKEALFTCHRAVTHSNLGRVYLEKGDITQALEHYIKATEGDNSRYITDYALALQKANKYDQALTQLDKALEISPEEELATLLKAEVERRKAYEADDERRSRIRQRIAELERRYREGKQVGPPAAGDQWTSRPMVLSLFVKNAAGPGIRTAFRDLLVARLTQLLGEQGRVQPVEREMMEQLLEELGLGTSALADEDTALRLGKLFAANLVGIGSLDLFGDELTVTLKLIETETSLPRIVSVESFDRGAGVSQVAQALCDKITAKVASTYPLKGKVVDVADGGELIINIGSKQGLHEEIRMDVFTAATDRKGMTIRGKRVGVAEISSVERNQAIATAVESMGTLQKGMLLQEVTGAS